MVGDFNYWNGTATPMRSLGSSGVWEVFVPEIGAGTRYKFEIIGRDGVRRLKADPMAQATEVPPATASVVFASDYEWDDATWMQTRTQHPVHASPMSIYEVHLGSWRQGLSYRQLAEELTDYVVAHGFTTWSSAGHGASVRRVLGLSGQRLLRTHRALRYPDDFRYLVDRLHQVGSGVLVDWVPAHFPKDDFALARFDGTPLYEHADPLRGEHPDWGMHVRVRLRTPGGAQLPGRQRRVLVRGVPHRRPAGRRCGLHAVPGLLPRRRTMVAQRLRRPGEPRCGAVHPGDERHGHRQASARGFHRRRRIHRVAGVTRATHPAAWVSGLKWNMGWMHDSLGYLAREPIHRQWHHNELTFALVYAWSENYLLPISHDEVVHGKGSLLGKMPGDHGRIVPICEPSWPTCGHIRASNCCSWDPSSARSPSGLKAAAWTGGCLDQPDHDALSRLVTDLNAVYRSSPALWSLDTEPAGFEWIDANDAGGNTLSWIRRGPRARWWPAWSTSARSRTTTTGWGFRSAAPGQK